MNRIYSTILRTFCLCAAISFLAPAPVRAAAAPDFPATMLNSPPLSKDGLKGKVIVLYFYEEDCPRCRESWPAKLKIAQSFKDKPVVFIAVNSGNSAPDVARYLKEVNCTWPTIVDQDRSFEKASGLDTPISLQNIYQAFVITPEGKFEYVDSQALDQSVNKYLSRAVWKIDPKDIPDSLKVAWQLMEIGNYNAAAGNISSVYKTIKDEPGKEAIKTLAAAITAEYNKALAPAKEAEATGNAWAALKGYQSIATQFSNLPESKNLKDKITKLSTDPAVAKELKAAKLWTEAQNAARSPSTVTQKRAIQQAQLIVKNYPDTEAATAAQAALDTIPK